VIKKIIFISFIVASILIGIFSPKYYLPGVVLMFFGFAGFLYNAVLFRAKIKEEVKELRDAIDSVIENAEPEVIIKNRNVKLLVDLKADIYELSRVLVDDVDFLRHDILNSLDIPLYVESSDRVFKNKEMKRICHKLGKDPKDLGNDILINDVRYTRVEPKKGFFYFLPASKVHGAE
jgi:hypothetical protein